MTKRTRQPPEPICIHFDWSKYMMVKPCKAGVEPNDVTDGPIANRTIKTMPCCGMCPDAKCAMKKLEEPKPEKKTDPQGKLF